MQLDPCLCAEIVFVMFVCGPVASCFTAGRRELSRLHKYINRAKLRGCKYIMRPEKNILEMLDRLEHTGIVYDRSIGSIDDKVRNRDCRMACQLVGSEGSRNMGHEVPTTQHYHRKGLET